MWRSRPVFISSTFRDMHAERDYLRSHVFPELEERLRSRRIHLEWVDLRLGVAVGSQHSEELRELQMLRVCLAEVRRCRPFLIALIGDRYGSIPPAERIKAAAQEESFVPESAGCSVTDLEINFGMLPEPGQQTRIFFYFREPLPYADMPGGIAAIYAEGYSQDAGAADRASRLLSLKQRVEVTLPDRVRHYTANWDATGQKVVGLESLGQTVLEDLWRELATEAGAEPVQVSWQQAERMALEDFSEDRSRDFVGRQQIISRLTDGPSPSETSWGVCVTGEPGSGKSALFGELYRRLQQSPALVLAHSASASLRSASVDRMLRRWIAELATILGVDAALRESTDIHAVDATFASLLGRIALKRPVILLIDALDQFEGPPRGRLVTWLPRLWPHNISLIATTVPGPSAEALAERPGIELLPLPPLDASEARSIIETITGRYHRTFDPEVLSALLAKAGEHGPPWGNPLWLVLAVEELNLLGADDFSRALDYPGTGAEQLRSLMIDMIAQMPLGIPELYDAMFEKAEELFDTNLVLAFLGLLAVSRDGWRQSDLQGLLPVVSREPWDELQVASLRRFFRSQVRQGGDLGQWRFDHSQMRVAVLRRLEARGIAEVELHKVIADHLLALSIEDPLRQSETMVHLLESQDWTRAASYYGNPLLSEAEIEGTTRALANLVLVAKPDGDVKAAQRLVRVLDASSVPGEVQAVLATRFLGGLWHTIGMQAPFDVLIILADGIRWKFETLVLVNPRHEELRRSLAESWEHVGNLQTARGDLKGAEESYRESLKLAAELTNEDSDNTAWQRELAASQSRVGATRLALGNQVEAEALYRASLVLRRHLTERDPQNTDWQQELSWSYDQLGSVQEARGDLEGAEASFRAALAIAEQLVALDPTSDHWRNDLSASYKQIGRLQILRGDLAGAERTYRKGFAINQWLADHNPENTVYQRNVSVGLNDIGNVLSAQGNLKAAEASYRLGLAIIERLASRDPVNAGLQRDIFFSRCRVGDVWQGDVSLRESWYRDSVAIMERLGSLDPENTDWQRDLSTSYYQLGDVQMARGDLTGVLQSYRRSLAIAERLADGDRGNARAQDDLAVIHTRMGSVQVTRGDLAGAEESYRAALEIHAHLVDRTPDNLPWQRHLSVNHEKLGDVQMARGDLAGAEVSFKASLAIAERLAQLEPRNVDEQKSLGVSHQRMGNLHVAQRDWVAAKMSYIAALQIFERLAKQEPGNQVWQGDLASCHGKVGEVQIKRGDVDGAEVSFRTSLALFKKLAVADPENANWQHGLVGAHQAMGIVYHARNAPAKMEMSFRLAIAIAERLAKRNPTDIRSRQKVAVLNWSLSQLYKMGDQHEEANEYRSRTMRELRAARELGVEMDRESADLLGYLEWGGT